MCTLCLGFMNKDLEGFSTFLAGFQVVCKAKTGWASFLQELTVYKFRTTTFLLFLCFKREVFPVKSFAIILYWQLFLFPTDDSWIHRKWMLFVRIHCISSVRIQFSINYRLVLEIGETLENDHLSFWSSVARPPQFSTVNFCRVGCLTFCIISFKCIKTCWKAFE